MQSRVFAIGILSSMLLVGCIQRTPHSIVQPITTISGSGAVKLENDEKSIDVIATTASLTKEIYSGSTLWRSYTSGVLEYGDINAPLVLTVFTEYHCEYCKTLHRNHWHDLSKEFIEAKKLRVLVIPMPIAKYPNSTIAIKSVMCAARQYKGTHMHNLLFNRVNKHRSSELEYAKELGLNTDAFDTCLDDEVLEEQLQKHATVLEALEVSVVPTLFLENEKKVGLPYYSDLRGWIESKISK